MNYHEFIGQHYFTKLTEHILPALPLFCNNFFYFLGGNFDNVHLKNVLRFFSLVGGVNQADRPRFLLIYRVGHEEFPFRSRV